MDFALIPIKARWALTELVLMGLCYMLAVTLNKKYKRNLDNAGFFLLIVLCCFFAGVLSVMILEFLNISLDWSWPKSFLVFLMTAVVAISLNYIYVIKGRPVEETDGASIQPTGNKIKYKKTTQTNNIQTPLPPIISPPQDEDKKTLPRMRSPLNTAIASVVMSIPDFIIAGVLLQIWLYPLKYPSRGMSWAVHLVILEFFIIHSAGIMGGLIEQNIRRRKKLLLLLCLSSVYSVMVYVLGSGTSSLQAFWLLCLNRAMPVITGRVLSKDAINQATSSYATSAVLFLLSMLISAFMWFPALGVTPEVIEQLGNAGDAPWNKQPYRILACGVIYYATFGVFKLYPVCEFMQKNKVMPAKQN